MISDIKRRAYHRSKIIQGQVDALIKAIDDEKYCVDILTQSLAIQKSLRSLSKLVLENHLRTHVKEAMTNGGSGDEQKIIDELLSLYELGNVRR